MAAILITDCTVTVMFTQGIKIVKIVTPATADNADTIDVSTIFDVGCFAFVSGETDKSYMDSATTWDDLSITLPNGAGSTDNEARTIIAFGT